MANQTDKILRALRSALNECQTRLNLAIRSQDAENRELYQAQLAHLEFKLQHYEQGAYDSLIQPGEIRRGEWEQP